MTHPWIATDPQALELARKEAASLPVCFDVREEEKPTKYQLIRLKKPVINEN